MRRLLLAVVVTAALTVPAVASATRGTFTCDGTVGLGSLGPPDYYSSTIDANVDVPAGATCSMYFATVTGNVTVEGILSGFRNVFQKNVTVNGGALYFPLCFSLFCPGGQNTVDGNFTASNPSGGILTLDATIFGKNVTVDGASGGVDFSYSTVSRSLSVSNSSGGISIFDVGTPGSLGVGKKLILSGNTGGVGLTNVVVTGNLNCDSNDPAPALTNVTAAKENGQCSPG
jgi:hypothetical protein